MPDDHRIRMYEVIDMMRFPLIILVVFSHMVGFSLPKVTLSANPHDIYTFVSELISHNLAKISVRFYFLVSGYFFFYKLRIWEWNKYSDQLKKKIRTILIPYLFWNAIIVLIGILANHFATHKMEIPSLYDTFWGLPADYPLWYMRD